MPDRRAGVMMGIGAYFLWGFLPLYWRLLQSATALEILAHRIAWSLVVLGVLLGRAGGIRSLVVLERRRVKLLGAASLFIGMNWGLYIWAVNERRVVETALGYFINPLVTVTLGVLVLGEKLRRGQWLALGLAFVAVLVLTLDYGRLPWIALVLAASFGAYGLLKKKAGVAAVPSLAIETAILVLPALIVIGRGELTGTGAFGAGSWATRILLASSGLVTAVPLLLFAGAANRVPLTTLGPLQYLSPTLQFLCGVVVFHEAMPLSRLVGFGLVWAALALFVVEGAIVARRARRNEPTTAATVRASAGS